MTETEFLRARLDEDERNVPVDDPHAFDCDSRAPRGGLCDCGYPARLLRETEAKRAILADIKEATAISPTSWLLAAKIVCHLAAVYENHPDYRQEWKP